MRRFLLTLPALWIGFGGLGCKNGKTDEVVCPTIHIEPHATLALAEPLDEEGTLALELVADGERESCTIEISDIGPSQEDCPEGDADCVVSSPSTRVNMSCKLLSVGGIKNDGSIPGFQTSGTPKQLSMTVRRGDVVLAREDFELEYAPAELIGAGCPKTQHAQVELELDPSGVAAPEGASKTAQGDGEVTPFDAEQTYGGRIHAPTPTELGAPLSRVVRTQEEYDALVDMIPEHRVAKTRDQKKNPDPLLQKPPIDFDKKMLVVGICPTFYCSYTLEGYTLEGETMVVHGRLPGEPEGAAMAQRPIGLGGQDSVGNYSAVLVSRHDGPVRFEERRGAEK